LQLVNALKMKLTYKGSSLLNAQLFKER